jgi:hypothetical protein
MSFGWVVDFACPPRQALGGPLVAATRLAEGARLEPDPVHCTPCCVAAVEGPACIGVVTTPIPPAAERWLMERLPGDLESIAGEVIKQAVAAGFEGKRAHELRGAGKLAGRGPLERSWGGFFRRFTLSSDQLLEQMFCAGDLEPAHALAILVQLSALAVDGRVPKGLDEGAGLAELAQDVAARRGRTQCTVTPTPSDEAAIGELKRFLRALHGAFCADARVLVVAD